MIRRIERLLLKPDATIRDALLAMESPEGEQHAGFVAVVDDSRRLLGVVTNGDVRRAMLRGLALDARIDSIATQDPLVVREDEVAVGSYAAVLQMIRASGRMIDPAAGKLAVVDSEGRIVDVIGLHDLLKRQSPRAQEVCVVGMGYVGLTVAVALADVGLTVHGVEANPDVRARLSRGELHIHEAGLDRAFRATLGRRLFVRGDVREAVGQNYIVAVGTPVDPSGEPVLADVEAAADSVGSVLKRGDLVALRSTVPIGTSRDVVLPRLEATSGLRAGRDFDFVFAPERTLAGSALAELRTLPQVIGGLNEASLEHATNLFRELTPSVVAVRSIEEAEAVKLLNNAYRDHVFAFANEVGLLCERWGLDTAAVIHAANDGYPRHQIPQASGGVGGTCLRKDPYLLLASARRRGFEPVLLGASRRVNEAMPRHVAEKVLAFLREKRIAGRPPNVFVVGFAFKGKPETSDMRDSPTLDLVRHLADVVPTVRAFDPVIAPEELKAVAGVDPLSVEDGFRGADAVVVMNNHSSYGSWTDLGALLASMDRPGLFVDSWRLFEPPEVTRVPGIAYATIGAGRTGSR